MKFRFWLFALLLPTLAQAAEPSTAGTDAGQAAQAIAAAEAAVKRADSVGFAWRDSEGMITQARQAADKQDFATAVKLAVAARRQGELAWQQYLDQNRPRKQ